jgi:glycosyltransferase involved in cell wall biosynthesis
MPPVPPPLVTVVVSVYRRADFLGLVLDALRRQTDAGFEVVVAEDNQGEEIAEVVARHRPALGDRLLHVSQPHRGFGKTRILNAALRASHHPFLVFLDGDCVAHPRLVATYRQAATPGRALFGRRVMLGPALTARLLAGEAPSPPSLLALLRSDSTRVEEAVRLPFFRKPLQPTGIWGCNWGVHRSHLEAVNGFDEDYVNAGVGEDVDVEWRLLASGVALESVKHRAIVYHLHHPAAYSGADVAIGRELLRAKQAANQLRCVHGLSRAGPEGG